MRKLKQISLLLLFTLLILACSQNSDSFRKGVLTINIVDGTSKDLNKISMTAASYVVTAYREGFDSVSLTLNPTVNISGSMSLDVGVWDVKAIAYNESGLAIGEGSTNIDVIPSDKNSCTIAISEYEGDGILSLTFSSLPDLNVRARILTADEYIEGELGTILTLSEDSIGVYKGVISLKNGFYFLSIEDSQGNILISTSFRIIKGQVVDAVLSLDDDNNVYIEINDSIQQTPNINITIDNDYVCQGDTISVKATVEGIDVSKYIWYFNNRLLSNENSSEVTIQLSENNMIGPNTIKCLVVDSDYSLVWSASKNVNVIEKSSIRTTIEIDGKVEFKMIGNVLIPESLCIDVMNGESSIIELSMPRYNYVYTFSKPTVINCEISGVEDYYYYFNVIENEESEKTTVFIVVDKEIENAAYLDIEFTHEFIQKEGTSRGISLNANRTEFPSLEDKYLHVGFIPLNNEIRHLRIKVSPDTYKQGSHTGSNANNAHWGVVIPSSFTVESGETFEVEISSQPYATAEFVFPNAAIVENFELILSNGYTYTQNNLDVVNNIAYLDLEITNQFYAILVSNDVIFLSKCPLTAGLNRISFEKYEDYIKTGIILDVDERYIVDYKFLSLFPRNGYVFSKVGDESILSRKLISSWPNDTITSKGGELLLINPFEDDFKVSAVETAGTDSYGKPITKITVIIDIPDDMNWVQVNYQYQFEVDDEIHRGRPLIWFGDRQYCLPIGEDYSSAKVFPGTYRGGGSVRANGGTGSKWVYAGGFKAEIGKICTVYLSEER